MRTPCGLQHLESLVHAGQSSQYNDDVDAEAYESTGMRLRKVKHIEFTLMCWCCGVESAFDLVKISSQRTLEAQSLRLWDACM